MPWRTIGNSLPAVKMEELQVKQNDKEKRVRGKRKSDELKLPAPVRPFAAPKQLADGGLKTPLVQQVYDFIMDSLDAGELAPGSRVVASVVAQRLGLSRAPVREALAVLAGQGVVELHPDRGAILRPLGRRDLAAIYEVTAPVASIGVRVAAERIHEGDNAERVRASMEAIHQAGHSMSPKVGLYLLLNEFHYQLNEIAERPYVDFVMKATSIEYWNRVLANEIDLDRHWPKYLENYQRMTDAILAGDGPSAVSVMQYHANWCIGLLFGSR
ncbi:MAG: GntR family transcriptional regulator [Novosphingobium sp.]|nr:GntR family transcriptional regulator [Novosphingobium sp.]